MPFCGTCKAQVTATDVTCPACGADLRGNPAPDPHVPQPPPRKKSWWAWWEEKLGREIHPLEKVFDVAAFLFGITGGAAVLVFPPVLALVVIWGILMLGRLKELFDKRETE